jgi:hypothetical protein
MAAESEGATLLRRAANPREVWRRAIETAWATPRHGNARVRQRP